MIIAFIGPMQSGKDTAAEFFKLPVKKFADPLYELSAFAQEFVGFPVEKDRDLLIMLGTQWARAKDPDVWVKLFGEVEGNVCVTDCRFWNEFRRLQELDAIFVYLERPWRERLLSEAKRQGKHWLRILPSFIKTGRHPSERNFGEFKKLCHYRINSGGTLEEYRERLSGLRKLLKLLV